MTHAEDDTLAETIAALARDMAPVRPLAPPAVRVSRWLVGATGLALLVVALLGVRTDLVLRLADRTFVLHAAILAALTVAAATSALLLAIPGAPRANAARTTTLMLTVAWAVALSWPLREGQAAWPAGWADLVHLTCAFRIAAVGVMPALVLLGMVRAAAPLDLRWAAVSVVVGGLGLGALGTQMVCMDNAAVHLVSWHLVPAMLATGIVSLLVVRLLR